ncbi:MAG: imidazole glycerol phosphate synthase subunit HisH [Rhodopila sp.]
MHIAVVDYGSGNLASASRALALAAERAGIEATVAVTADPAVVEAADRVVLPGQGAATGRGVPFLGICVGMQLMAERGLEHTVTPGFGWIRGDVAEMPAPGLRLPQMGWNGLDFVPGVHPLLDGLEPGDHVYFVHSYALVHGAPSETIATTDYGGTVPAIVVAGNRAGTQFHVEKSQDIGIRLLANFLRWAP